MASFPIVTAAVDPYGDLRQPWGTPGRSHPRTLAEYEASNYMESMKPQVTTTI